MSWFIFFYHDEIHISLNWITDSHTVGLPLRTSCVNTMMGTWLQKQNHTTVSSIQAFWLDTRNSMSAAATATGLLTSCITPPRRHSNQLFTTNMVLHQTQSNTNSVFTLVSDCWETSCSQMQTVAIKKLQFSFVCHCQLPDHSVGCGGNHRTGVMWSYADDLVRLVMMFSNSAWSPVWYGFLMFHMFGWLWTEVDKYNTKASLCSSDQPKNLPNTKKMASSHLNSMWQPCNCMHFMLLIYMVHYYNDS